MLSESQSDAFADLKHAAACNASSRGWRPEPQALCDACDAGPAVRRREAGTDHKANRARSSRGGATTIPFFSPREAVRVLCGAELCGAEAGAFSAQPLCTWNSGASRGDLAQEGCAVAFDMVDAHTGSPPCRKAVHSKACALRGAGT